MYVSDVQHLCNIKKSTASRTIASLADKGLGFISTSRDTEDDRRKLLRPSAQLIKMNNRMSKEYRKYRDATR